MDSVPDTAGPSTHSPALDRAPGGELRSSPKDQDFPAGEGGAVTEFAGERLDHYMNADRLSIDQAAAPHAASTSFPLPAPRPGDEVGWTSQNQGLREERQSSTPDTVAEQYQSHLDAHGVLEGYDPPPYTAPAGSYPSAPGHHAGTMHFDIDPNVTYHNPFLNAPIIDSWGFGTEPIPTLHDENRDPAGTGQETIYQPTPPREGGTHEDRSGNPFRTLKLDGFSDLPLQPSPTLPLQGASGMGDGRGPRGRQTSEGYSQGGRGGRGGRGSGSGNRRGRNRRNNQRARGDRPPPLNVTRGAYTGTFGAPASPFAPPHPHSAGYMLSPGFAPPSDGFYPPANGFHQPYPSGPPPAYQAALEQYQYETGHRVFAGDQYGNGFYPPSTPQFPPSAGFGQPPPAFEQFQPYRGQGAQNQYGIGDYTPPGPYFPLHQDDYPHGQSYPPGSGTYMPSAGPGADYGPETSHQHGAQFTSRRHPQFGYYNAPQRGRGRGRGPSPRAYDSSAQHPVSYPFVLPEFEPGSGPWVQPRSQLLMRSVTVSAPRNAVGRGGTRGEGAEEEVKEEEVKVEEVKEEKVKEEKVKEEKKGEDDEKADDREGREDGEDQGGK